MRWRSNHKTQWLKLKAMVSVALRAYGVDKHNGFAMLPDRVFANMEKWTHKRDRGQASFLYSNIVSLTEQIHKIVV